MIEVRQSLAVMRVAHAPRAEHAQAVASAVLLRAEPDPRRPYDAAVHRQP